MVFRIAIRTVPREWRATLRADLEEEAASSGRGGWWCSWHALRAAIRLRPVRLGDVTMTEVRYVVRSLMQARWFAIGAILTFALGIGVNVAVFSAVDRMLFRPLPYADAGSLVVMGEYPIGDSRPYGTVRATDVIGARQLPGVAEVATTNWTTDRYRVEPSPDGATHMSFVQSSYSALRVLGVHPVLGGDFTEDDARNNRHRVLISYEVWQRVFGGRADAVGRKLYGWTAGTTAEVAGVLPEDFIPPQVTLPTLSWSGLAVTDVTFDSAGPRDRSTPPILRLKPGQSVAVVQSQLDALITQLHRADPPRPPGSPGSQIRLTPLREALFGRYATYLLLVFAAATLVLLVGCANLASLLLVRARSREHRAAVQLALGASAGRIMRSAVIEALILSIAGGVTALVVLQLGNAAVAAWLPPLFSKYAAPVLAGRVMVFSIALAILCAVTAGVLPGWRASRVDVLSVLQRGGRSGTARLRGSGALLAAEIAVSVTLVACAALTGRSLVGLLNRDIGFEKRDLWTVSAFVPNSPDKALLRQQYGDVLDALRQIPGIRSATGANVLPMVGAVAEPMFSGDRQGQRWSVTDQFVETLGIRLIAGRSLSAADVRSGASVGMLSESGLRLALPGVTAASAIGRFLEWPGEAPREVIGVVSDVRGDYERPPVPSVYVPLGSDKFRFMMYAARVTPGSRLTALDISRGLEQRGLAVSEVSASTVTAQFAAGVRDQRFRAQLFMSFGAIALILAVIGLYAVQSFNVVLREREFGIRVSLGASRRDLWSVLARQTVGPLMVGCGMGMLLVYWAAQFLQSFLVGVDARDPWTFLIAAGTLTAAAIAATLLPARRAGRVDPVTWLRNP
jgi:predicted permease